MKKFLKDFLKNCLMLLGIALVLVVSCSVYVHHPRFSGSSPVGIGVVRYETNGAAIAYLPVVTNRITCETIVNELRTARFAGFGSKPFAESRINYGNGQMDRLLVSANRDQGDFAFFFHGFYRMRREPLFTLLREAGIDVSQF